MNYNTDNEVWKDIKGHEGYQVSDLGNVRSLERKIKRKNRWGYVGECKMKGSTIKPNDNGKGYKYVSLGRKNRAYVHRLVAEHFLTPKEGRTEVNHIDNDRSNNAVSNLEWVTRQENIEHAVSQNRNARGESSGVSKLKESDVRKIKELCKTNITQREIGEMFGVQQSIISAIKLGRKWKHVQ